MKIALAPDHAGSSYKKQLVLYYRLTMMILVILVIGALGYLTREVGSMQWLVANELRMRTFVRTCPEEAWLLGFCIYTVFSLVPGTTGKSVVWGWLFGFWPAVLIVDFGLTVAAVASFLVARFILRGAVTDRLGGAIEKLDRTLGNDGAFYLLMMRLVHAPFTFVNYGAGVTGARLSTFSWTTALGVLPGTMIFVFVGTRIPTLSSLAEKGVWQLVDPLLVGCLAATFAFPLLIRWTIRKSRFRSRKRADLELPEVNEFF